MRERHVQENRLVKRLTNYWMMLRANDKLPDIHKFNYTAISDLWDNCFIISIQPSSGLPVFKYDKVGRHIVEAFGSNPTGQIVTSAIRMVPGGKIIEEVEKCIASQDAVVEQGQFISSKSHIIKYRACLIPFGSSGGKITHIVVGLSWKRFS